MATGKPRNAIEFTQPSCVSVSWRVLLNSVRMPARMAKVMAVTIKATQLAANRREGFIRDSLRVRLGEKAGATRACRRGKTVLGLGRRRARGDFTVNL